MAAPTTTARGIVLTLAPYTLTITEFGTYPGRYPRIPGTYKSLTRSLRGTPGRRGPINRPWQQWTFDARLDLSQQETLRRMEASHWANPRPWTIYDYTNYWSENGTSRTRAIAPNSTEASDGTTIAYYPQWQGEPVAAFEWAESSSGIDIVSFQLQESGVVAA